MQKIQVHNIGGKIFLAWITGWLSERKQRVCIQEERQVEGMSGMECRKGPF